MLRAARRPRWLIGVAAAVLLFSFGLLSIVMVSLHNPSSPAPRVRSYRGGPRRGAGVTDGDDSATPPAQPPARVVHDPVGFRRVDQGGDGAGATASEAPRSVRDVLPPSHQQLPPLGKPRFNGPLPPPPVFDVSGRAIIPTAAAGDDYVRRGQAVIDANAELLRASPERLSSVTLVSGIWDLGRGSMATDATWDVFRRPFSYYLDGLRQFLSYRLPKVLYCDADALTVVQPLLDAAVRAGNGTVKVIVRSAEEVAREFAWTDLAESVRTRRSWSQQSPLVANSPQALLPLFNPVVMSKLRLTRDVARWNPFQTDGFMWIDGACGTVDVTACQAPLSRPRSLQPTTLHAMRCCL
jgi:hypothetical protein